MFIDSELVKTIGKIENLITEEMYQKNFNQHEINKVSVTSLKINLITETMKSKTIIMKEKKREKNKSPQNVYYTRSRYDAIFIRLVS